MAEGVTAAGHRLMSNGVRSIWLRIHRWVGLTLAAFLISAGLTGALMAFNEDLDRWLNPELFRVTPQTAMLSPFEIRERAEEVVPQARVEYLELALVPGKAAHIHLSARDPHVLEVDEIFLNPHNGALLGSRLWGKVAFDRAHIMPLIFRFHRTLVLPGTWGNWLLGIVAMAWCAGSLVGLYLSLPESRRRFWSGWKSAWRVRWKSPLPRLSFDVHRATGLWFGLLMLVISVSAVRLNLYDEVFLPAMRAVLPFHDPLASEAARTHSPGEPQLSWEQALSRSRSLMAEHARREGYTVEGERTLSLDREHGAFVYSVKSSLDVRRSGGETRLYIDANDGREIGFAHPHSAAGNAVSSWLMALHRAHVGGVAYQILISIAGLALAIQSVAGIIVWLGRRRRPGGT